MALITKRAMSQFYGGKDITDPVVLLWFGRLSEVIPVIRTFSVAINPPSIAANTTGVATATVKGLLATNNYVVQVNKPTHTAGLGIVNCRVSADDTIEITFMNTTGSPIDAGEETYTGYAIQL